MEAKQAPVFPKANNIKGGMERGLKWHGIVTGTFAADSFIRN
jgi:hypothetical protein